MLRTEIRTPSMAVELATVMARAVSSWSGIFREGLVFIKASLTM